MVAVREDGLVADFYSSKARGKHPGMIVIGGSQGGIDRASAVAEMLAGMGYAALAVAYFKFEQLPKYLKEIRLEYFKGAFDWMCSNPLVDSDRIGLIGHSKGGEASLIVYIVGTTFGHALGNVFIAAAIPGGLLMIAWNVVVAVNLLKLSEAARQAIA